MKRILFAAMMVVGGIMISPNTNAQVRVGVNINIGDQPPWRSPGHDYVEYYYLPDIECYYHVPRRQFVYMDGGNWMYSPSLPYQYRDYNLYNGYKVVVNRPDAYRYHNNYRVQYPRRVQYYENNYYRRDNNRWDNNRRYDNRWDNNRRDNNRWDRNDRNDRRDNDRHDNGRHRGWDKNKRRG